MSEPVRIDRWKPATGSEQRDRSGETPVSTYLRYLQDRRSWEERAWRSGGPTGKRFPSLLEELEGIHARLTTRRAAAECDRSVVKPPPRDVRRVMVVAVQAVSPDHTVIETLEAEFDPSFPVPYRVSARLVDGVWRLESREAVHGRQSIDLL